MQVQMCSLEELMKHFPLHRRTKYFLCSALGTRYCKGKNSQAIVSDREGTRQGCEY